MKMDAVAQATARMRRCLPTVLLLLGTSLVVFGQQMVDRHFDKASRILDVLYFGSPQAVKRLAMGYDGLLADVYWMRTVQYYGRRDQADRRASRYGNLPALLSITATLDPRMLDVYHFGSTFLAEDEPLGAGRPREALELLDLGIERNPKEWRLQFDKGIVYFHYLKEFHSAGQAWFQGAQIEGAPEWMDALAAKALSRGGAIETAKQLWTHRLRESSRQDIRENARNHLQSIEADERRWLLEFLLMKYAGRYGSFPKQLSDMIRPDFMGSVPLVDPSGVAFDYDHRKGTVQVSSESKMRYLKMEYDYREEYLQNLTTLFEGTNREGSE